MLSSISRMIMRIIFDGSSAFSMRSAKLAAVAKCGKKCPCNLLRDRPGLWSGVGHMPRLQCVPRPRSLDAPVRLRPARRSR